jgi:hypothetical protein
MTFQKTNPATLGACRARVDDRLGSEINPENTPPHLQLQVRRLISRFGMPAPVAATVAALAYETVGRRA